MKSVFAGVAALAALAATAHANDGKGARGAGMIPEGQDRVSVAELNERQAKRAAAMDLNGDGYITRAEVQTFREGRRAEWQARRFPDANKDGVVDRLEWENASRERFNRLDKNGDGVLTEDELAGGRDGRGKRGRK